VSGWFDANALLERRLANLELIDVGKRYGATSALKAINLSVPDGEFCAFLGPSGCGKSTLLRIVAGLAGDHEGTVRIGGRDVTAIAPSDRGVAMVFQSFALYPHMNVARNISFGLSMQGVPQTVIAEKLAKAARILQLEPLLERRPAELSGGQRQRVAIGRALVREPDLFLFDEPLSSLDAALRVQMRIELERLHEELRATMIYVTHDQVEAMTMADRIVVMNAGHIEQVGDPLSIYRQPANLFVAGFIGTPRMNFLPAQPVSQHDEPALLIRGSVRVPVPLAVQLPGRAAEQLILGVRPEHLKLAEPRAGHLNGTIRLAEHLGSETLLHIDVGLSEHIIAKDEGMSRWHSGEAVAVLIDPAVAHVFDPSGPVLSQPVQPSAAH
jgi:multiple sugar transport system ATP-binding protein